MEKSFFLWRGGWLFSNGSQMKTCRGFWFLIFVLNQMWVCAAVKWTWHDWNNGFYIRHVVCVWSCRSSAWSLLEPCLSSTKPVLVQRYGEKKKHLQYHKQNLKGQKRNCKIFLIAFNYKKVFVVCTFKKKKKCFIFGTVLTISCQVISFLPFEFLMLNVSNVYWK